VEITSETDSKSLHVQYIEYLNGRSANYALWPYATVPFPGGNAIG